MSIRPGLPEQPLRLAGQGEIGGEHPVPGGIRQRGGQCFGLGVRIAAVDQDVGSGFGKRPDQFGSDPDGSAR